MISGQNNFMVSQFADWSICGDIHLKCDRILELHIHNNNNNCLLGSCSHKAGLDNVTYRYTYSKIHKIHYKSHTTEDVRDVIYVDQVIQLSYWQFSIDIYIIRNLFV